MIIAVSDFFSVYREYSLGNQVDDMQVGCLWQGDHILTVSLSGFINYLDKSNTAKPYRVIKVNNHNVVKIFIFFKFYY